ncbi:hypothetical protein BDQ12DRAFT_715090 [Crucibulum laeve]|uniref:NACHT domain-containing protein n=1 Tax=Crucibulum laeve TaxID=68775 RepID=A0A5C3LQZ7_9AGAR|nr:hypothetical protein BDQ12DRAFT_715090 [Crucibulum laeve]
MTASSFAGAHNFVIREGAAFYDIQGDYRTAGLSGLQILRQFIAPGAHHDSSERSPPPRCHPGTRTQVISRVMHYLGNSHRSSGVLWLNGAVGAGKSTISQTVAEMCEEKSCIFATFFFSRTTPDRDNERRLVPTIVYQLAQAIPALKSYVNHALENDPTILEKSPATQIRKLLVEPLRIVMSGDSDSMQPIVIIIDGLDECGGDKEQCTVLDMFNPLLLELSLQVRVLISSRPEAHIQRAFELDPLKHSSTVIRLDKSFYPDDDIRIFLENGFEDILRDPDLYRALSNVPRPWPPPAFINKLVQRSFGQFLYASTILKFVGDPDCHPNTQLSKIMETQSSGSSPFSTIDNLYVQILTSSPNIGRTMEVLGFFFIIHLGYSRTSRERLDIWDVMAIIEELLGLSVGDSYIFLRRLRSVLHIPPRELITPGLEIGVFSTSFPEFLADPSRSGAFFVDAAAVHRQIARCCLRLLATRRQKTLGWEYAVRFWCHHCSRSIPDKSLLEKLSVFDIYKYWIPAAVQYNSLDNILNVTEWLDKAHVNGSPSLHITTLDEFFKARIEALGADSQDLKTLLRAIWLHRNACGTPALIRELFERYSETRQRHLLEPVFSFLLKGSDMNKPLIIKYQAFSSFIMDPKRSGSYLFSNDLHTSIALHMIRYLDLGGTAFSFKCLAASFHNFWTYHLYYALPTAEIVEALYKLGNKIASDPLRLSLSSSHICTVIEWLQRVSPAGICTLTWSSILTGVAHPTTNKFKMLPGPTDTPWNQRTPPFWVAYLAGPPLIQMRQLSFRNSGWGGDFPRSLGATQVLPTNAHKSVRFTDDG